MMKHLTVIVALLFQASLLHAQVLERHIIAPGGASFSGAFAADWTMGETVVQSAVLNGTQIQQGYQQPLPASGSGVLRFSDRGVLMYPNPGSNLLFLECKGIPFNCSVEVFNITGERLYQRSWNTGMPCKLELGSVPPGSYQVRITSEVTRFSATWIKV